MLYPRESESREVKELNGMWHFKADFSTGSAKAAGFATGWHKRPLPMVSLSHSRVMDSSWRRGFSVSTVDE